MSRFLLRFCKKIRKQQTKIILKSGLSSLFFSGGNLIVFVLSSKRAAAKKNVKVDKRGDLESTAVTSRRWEERFCKHMQYILICIGRRKPLWEENKHSFHFFFRAAVKGQREHNCGVECCCEKMMNCCQQSLFAPMLFRLLPRHQNPTTLKRPYP